MPGAQLRAVREAKGLSLDAVAEVTRFGTQQLEALERDDYTRFPGMTIVRGFVRGYAKFLKLDPEPLLAMLDAAMPATVVDIRPPKRMGEVEQASFIQRLKLGRILGVLLFASLLLVGFWYFIRPDLALVREQWKPTAVSTSSAAPSPMAQEVVESASPAVVAATTAPNAASNTASNTASNSAPSIENPSPSTSAAAVDINASKSAVDTAQAAAEKPPTEVAGDNKLHLEFTGLSWVEVRDATQRIIFSGEYSAGASKVIDGRPPFQLWIGKAPNVHVSFGGRQIDLQPHTRAEVARLKVE
jgi:cytoskeleton protein RodZ